MRVALFNVAYSANLGDGLISINLVRALQRNRPDVSVDVIDLAGRSHYGEGASRRSLALAMLKFMPPMIRVKAVKCVLGSKLRSLRPSWRAAVSRSDVVVIGGGNLLADADLNFPMKISTAAAEARMAERPLAVFGVGVADNWSKEGRKMFEAALAGAPLAYASVRDERSAHLWEKLLSHAGAAPARVCGDPALLSEALVPVTRADAGSRPRLGVNICHPDELQLHADETMRSVLDLGEWWVEFIRLAVTNFDVTLFTNGSAMDEDYLSSLTRMLSSDENGWRVAPRPTSPEVLAALVADCDVLIGHRLHAHIAGYAYGVPTVGLTWDAKLKSFFEGVGRERFVLRTGVDSPQDALALILSACVQGVDPVARRRIIDQAWRDIDDLYANLAAAYERAPVTATDA